MISQRQASRAEELRMMVNAREPVYQRAVEMLKGENKDMVVRRNLVEKMICDLILSFQAGDSGDKAIFIIGQAAQLARELVAPLEIIAAQERERKTLGEMVARAAEGEHTATNG